MIQTLADEIAEATATGNIQLLEGRWKPESNSLALLDDDLIESGRTGFTITIDEEFGETYRRLFPESFLDEQVKVLERSGHQLVASGSFRADFSGLEPMMITKKEGGLYLWFGSVFLSNPRIFLGRGSKEISLETLVVEWPYWVGENPAKLELDFATVIYQRAPSSEATENVKRPESENALEPSAGTDESNPSLRDSGDRAGRL